MVQLTIHGKSKGLELLNPHHPIAMKLAMVGTHHKFGGCGDWGYKLKSILTLTRKVRKLEKLLEGSGTGTGTGRPT